VAFSQTIDTGSYEALHKSHTFCPTAEKKTGGFWLD